MPTFQATTTIAPAAAALRYVEAYDKVDRDTLRALLHPDSFRFSHHNRSVYADSSNEFIEMVDRMAREVFPGRRFTEIRALHVVQDVVLLDTSWSGTLVSDLANGLKAGTELNLQIKSLIVVADGRITEIRDHD